MRKKDKNIGDIVRRSLKRRKDLVIIDTLDRINLPADLKLGGDHAYGHEIHYKVAPVAEILGESELQEMLGGLVPSLKPASISDVHYMERGFFRDVPHYSLPVLVGQVHYLQRIGEQKKSEKTSVLLTDPAIIEAYGHGKDTVVQRKNEKFDLLRVVTVTIYQNDHIPQHTAWVGSEPYIPKYKSTL